MSAIQEKVRVFYDLLRYGKGGGETAGYGTVYGVYLPGLLSMFGVVIYLRLAWITGSIGLTGTVLIISLSCLIMFITALSIGSTATNKLVEGGGTYYMISRSLGIEIGSSVGIPLFIAQAMVIAFCAMGFAEFVTPLFPDIPLLYLGSAALCSMMFLSFSTGIALNIQLLIFLILGASFASLFTGTPIQEGADTPQFLETMKIPFWTGFAIFFPAVTGVEAGVSMSGDLHSPRKSLPLGIIAVLLTALSVYLALIFFFWTSSPRGLLVSDGAIIVNLAQFPLLVKVGIWAATLSGILGGILSSSRTLQALARDGILPRFLGKEFGPSKAPRLASMVSFVIALACMSYGSINQLAPLLTMFYLIAYAVLNLTTGLEGLLNNPSWRPTFRTPWYVSIGGGIVCIMAMLMIDSGACFAALAFVLATYFLVRRRRLSSKWEDIRHGILMFLSRFAIYRLSSSTDSLRSWRPNFLVFSRNPSKVSNMINLTSAITKDKGFLTLTSVFSPTMADQEKADRWKKVVTQLLSEQKIEALVEFGIDSSFVKGAKKFLTTYGIGPITPNTIVLGSMYKKESLQEYLEVIQFAHKTQKNVIVLRQEHELHSKSKKIDIWWDDASKKNSELMILLSHMLTSNKTWKGTTIRLRSIVPDENGRLKRLAYFQSFLSSSRLRAVPEIFVDSKGPENIYQIASQFSSDADMVFLGLRPKSEDESLEDFGKYYLSVQEQTKKLEHVAFVTNSDEVELGDIFK